MYESGASEEGLEFLLSEKLPDILSVLRCSFDYVWAETAHADPHSEIIHVLNGWIKVETPEYTVTCSQGDTVYIPAGTLHRDILPLEEAHEVYLVQFEWEGEQAVADILKESQLTSFSLAYKNLVSDEFDNLYQWFISNQPFHAHITRLHLLQILYKLTSVVLFLRSSEQCQPDDLVKSRRLQIISYAKQYIRSQFHTNITLEKIASELNISTYYLSRVFSSESSFTLSNYLTSIRMENAAKLLEDPCRNISEVAYMVGFSDPHYFSKVFRLHFGVSPKTYRASLVPADN